MSNDGAHEEWRAACDALLDECKAHRLTIYRLSEDAKQLQVEISRLRADNAELGRRSDSYRALLDAVYTSTSWKLGLPLRALGTLAAWLKGRRAGAAGRRVPPDGGRRIDESGSTSHENTSEAGPSEPFPGNRAQGQARRVDFTDLGRLAALEPDEAELTKQRGRSVAFSYRPLISIIVPVYKVQVSIVMELIESVRSQTYGQWELCIAHSDPDNEAMRAFLVELAERDVRVKLSLPSERKGISDSSNEAFSLARGEFIALLDHDDLLAPSALFDIVEALNRDRSIEFIYSDKDQLSEKSERDRPFFKPDWSPDLMLSVNYLTHLNVLRADLVRRVGAWRPATDGAQDWDLFNRVIAASEGRVLHIPRVHYHWRRVPTSAASRGLAAKPYALEAQVQAVQDSLRQRGRPWTVRPQCDRRLRIGWDETYSPAVSIILVPGLGQTSCLAEATELAEGLRYPNFRIFTLGGVDEKHADRVSSLGVDHTSPIEEQLGHAVRHCPDGVLLFLGAGVRPLAPDLLSEIVGPLQDPGIGLVGTKQLDRETSLIRHAGLVFLPDGRVEAPWAGEQEDQDGPFGRSDWYRNWTAVSGACIGLRKEIWDRIDGLAGRRRHSRPDIDLSFRAVSAGYRILYNPFARLIQSETTVLETPRDPPSDDRGLVTAFLQGRDPYFNPNLTVQNGRIGLAGG